jgi:hypothetical protein
MEKTSATDLITGNKRAAKPAEASDRQSRISSGAVRNVQTVFVPSSFLNQDVSGYVRLDLANHVAALVCSGADQSYG